MVDLADRLLAGDVRALARAISMVEDRDAGLPELLVAVRGRAGQAHVVGLTGPPGSGKSTLGDGIVERWRALGRTVGVLAVDRLAEYPQYDQMEAAVSGAFTAAFNHYVHDDLKFPEHGRYELLSGTANSQWNWKRNVSSFSHQP